MAKLKDLVLAEGDGFYYLRADWDNDRNHSVIFESDSPYDIIVGLEELAYLIRQDKTIGRI